jgi:crotonobetaine/carnitine-CoA ligase
MMAPGDEIESLGALVERAARLWPDRPALICDVSGRQVTFEELDRWTNRWANALAGLGVERRDRVAVSLPNGLEFPVTWLALAKLRATMVPLNRNYRLSDAGYVLTHSRSKLVVTDGANVELFEQCRADGAPIDAPVTIDGAGETRNLRELAETSSGESQAQVAVREDIVNVQYTSGTTGHPKGCLLSHGYWLTLARKNTDAPPAICADDVLLTAQPFSYMDPQWNLTSALMVGAPLVVLDGFHPSTFWDRVRAHGVTFFYCLGAMPTLMLKMPPSELDRQNEVTRVYCSKIPVNAHEELERRFGVPWFETYGMTEVGGVCSVSVADHDGLIGSGCIGTPNPLREVRIVDERGVRVERGQEGELLVRGVGLMDAYLDDPQANANAFREGWFHTGDKVRADTIGRLYFAGRTKDMIRRGGENVAAAEVEEVLASHPAVRLAACVAVPDEIREEEIKAYVVPADPAAPPSPTELADFCSTRLARFKIPRYWQFCEALPMTPSERVAKGELLARHADDPLRGCFDCVDGVWI